MDKAHKLKEILERQDQAWSATQDVRERAADDLIFSRVTQWDDSLDWCNLEYRGEFNLIWKERQRLLSEMRANQISPDFKPVDGADPDAADILNGMYRTDMRNNMSKEAVDVAVGDMIDAGFGAWRLVTEYVNSDNDMDNRQVIRRVPIHEANNMVFFDASSKRADKSDAMWCSVLTQMDEEAYERLAEEYGFDDDEMPSNFSSPAKSYVFPWRTGNNRVVIGEVYERTKKTERIVIMEHPALGVQVFKRSEIKTVLDDMLAAGWVTVGQKTREYFRVDKYLVSGERILYGPERIAGEHIPIVPLFGNWYFVEGTEVWSGITRLAKDPQRLYNMQMSYLADIAAKGPRRKPIFSPKQVQGLQHLWEGEQNYPYYLLNDTDSNGNPLPAGPLGYIEPENVPEATAALIQASRQNVEDVTSPGMPQDVLDPTASGKAIMAVQSRIDNQSFVYMDNLATAMRRDGEIYASMARAIYDTPREVVLTGPDGAESKAQVMEQVQDMATGQWVTLNDLSKGKFDVYVDIGPTFQSQKQQTRAELMQIMASTQDPQLLSILQMQYLMLLDGQSMEVLRKFARRNLLQMGIIEPETQEDIQYLQQMAANSQNQQPSPEALLAQAELMKGQAAMMREEREAFTAHSRAQNDAVGTQVDVFKAQTDRMNTQIEAEKAGASIRLDSITAQGKQLENAEKLAMALRGRVMERQQMMLTGTLQ